MNKKAVVMVGVSLALAAVALAGFVTAGIMYNKVRQFNAKHHCDVFAGLSPTELAKKLKGTQKEATEPKDGHAKREACFEGPERSEPEGCASRRGRVTLPTAGGGVEGDVWLSRQWKRQGAYLKELIVKSKTKSITNDEKELFKRGTNANKCI